jgi:hypothetical protein
MATKKQAGVKLGKTRYPKGNTTRKKVETAIIRGKSIKETAAETGLSRQRVEQITAEPDFQARIAARVEAAASLSDAEVIGTLADHMRADVTEIFDEDGHFDLQKIRQKRMGHLIRKLKARREWEGKGEDATPVDIIEIELYSSQAAAIELGKMKGLYKEPAKNPHDERDRVERVIAQWMKETGGSRDDAVEHLGKLMPEVGEYIN